MPYIKKKSLLREIGEHKFWGTLLSPFMFNQYIKFSATAIIVIVISFTAMDYSLKWDFVGLTNYLKIFHDPVIGLVFFNTIVFIVLTLFIKIALGLYLSLATTYYIKDEGLGTMFRIIWLLPKVSPGIIEALLWFWIFSPGEGGILNNFMGYFYGWEPIAWLDKYPLLINIGLAGVMGTSITMIMLSSAIQAMDKTYFYVAQVDGASEWIIFKDIILPHLRWPLTFLTLWQGLALLTSYESILLLTDGGPMFRSETWALYAFHTAFFTLDFGYGSAISLLMLPLVIGIIYSAYKVFGFKKLISGAN